MAHLRCQACNARVDESDVTCPVCNVRIVKSRNSGLILLSVILLCVIASAILWPLLKTINRSMGESTTPEISIVQIESKVKAAALDAVLLLMKDPSSTTFRDIKVSHGQGGSVVCGSVNSKNSFGGFSGFKKFLYFYESGHLEMESQVDINRFWTLFC